MEALTRKPVSTQLTAEGDAANSCASAGSAGTTSVWDRAKAMPAPVRVRRTGVGRCDGAAFTPGTLLTPRQRSREMVERRLDLVVHGPAEDRQQRLRGQWARGLDRLRQLVPALGV